MIFMPPLVPLFGKRIVLVGMRSLMFPIHYKAGHSQQW